MGEYVAEFSGYKCTKGTKPAPGQVWQSRKYARSINVIDRIEGDTIQWAHGGWDHAAKLNEFYECIGIETRNGRVMVGERRACWGYVCTVVSVRDDAYVIITHDRIKDEMPCAAADVAQWPLVHDPFAVAAKDAIREPAAHDHVTLDGMRLPGALLEANRLAPVLGLSHGGKCPWCGGLPCRFSVLGGSCARDAREQRRREIDAVLREDARRFPAFATARKAALLFEIETGTGYGRNHDAATTRTHISCFHEYERLRGGMSKPSAEALAYAGPGGDDILEATTAAYERARGLP